MAALSAHCFRCSAERAVSSENIGLCSALPASQLENRQTFQFTGQGTILGHFNFLLSILTNFWRSEVSGHLMYEQEMLYGGKFKIKFNIKQRRLQVNEWVWSTGGKTYRRENRNRRTLRKPFPLAICPPKISHGLTYGRIWGSAVRCQQINASAMARPPSVLAFKLWNAALIWKSFSCLEKRFCLGSTEGVLNGQTMKRNKKMQTASDSGTSLGHPGESRSFQIDDSVTSVSLLHETWSCLCNSGTANNRFQSGRSRVRNPVNKTRFTSSRNCPDWPWDQPSHLSNGYRNSLPEVKRWGHVVNYSPQSRAEVKNEWSYTSPPPIRPHGMDTTILPLTFSTAILWNSQYSFTTLSNPPPHFPKLYS